jgi:hypothetical protein
MRRHASAGKASVVLVVSRLALHLSISREAGEVIEVTAAIMAVEIPLVQDDELRLLSLSLSPSPFSLQVRGAEGWRPSRALCACTYVL